MNQGPPAPDAIIEEIGFDPYRFALAYGAFGWSRSAAARAVWVNETAPL